MDTKGRICIEVRGGVIQSINASKDIAELLEIEIYDFDVDEDIDVIEAEWDNIEEDETMIEIY